MRISNNNLSRNTSTREIKKKVFAMLEGKETEPNYFVNLFNMKKFSNIDFLYFEKEKKETGWSNPKKLMDYLGIYVVDKANELTFGDVKGILFSYIIDNDNNLDFTSFKIRFNEVQQEKGIKNSELFDKKIFDEILVELKDTSFSDLLYNNFDLIINEVKTFLNIYTFDPAIDTIVLIVDRDKGSFTDPQYDYILDHIEKLNIDFVVTNPCFEFYLALHIDDCSDADRDKLLKNDIEENGKTYTYNYLKSKDSSYTKKMKNVQFYVERYEIGIANSKKFETDINDLKNKVGSNIGIWLEKILSKGKSDL